MVSKGNKGSTEGTKGNKVATGQFLKIQSRGNLRAPNCTVPSHGDPATLCTRSCSWLKRKGGRDADRCEDLDDRAYAWASGTSMAVPHVAGVAALYLSENPTATPAQVKAAILSAATSGVLNPERLRAGTPNRVLYSAVTQFASPHVQAATGP